MLVKSTFQSKSAEKVNSELNTDVCNLSGFSHMCACAFNPREHAKAVGKVGYGDV